MGNCMLNRKHLRLEDHDDLRGNLLVSDGSLKEDSELREQFTDMQREVTDLKNLLQKRSSAGGSYVGPETTDERIRELEQQLLDAHQEIGRMKEAASEQKKNWKKNVEKSARSFAHLRVDCISLEEDIGHELLDLRTELSSALLKLSGMLYLQREFGSSSAPAQTTSNSFSSPQYSIKDEFARGPFREGSIWDTNALADMREDMEARLEELERLEMEREAKSKGGDHLAAPDKPLREGSIWDMKELSDLEAQMLKQQKQLEFRLNSHLQKSTRSVASDEELPWGNTALSKYSQELLLARTPKGRTRRDSFDQDREEIDGWSSAEEISRTPEPPMPMPYVKRYLTPVDESDNPLAEY